ncbi:hypothetical protein MKQ68_13765 [Chitinophaga horti]|uniref:DUF4625 domain-containing protein n=1 Tax=Chitinophaga horti TaxID=2920382 RepID=A0ABY6IUV6_9BACT|nr:hypothetical protein [Chitinophaga horti]UYQ91159.1 hypothetical protein MKQ68_13765 [Chitinophaga horti]
MRNILLIVTMMLVAFTSCKKENIYDKFPPEVLFYANANVENADFVTTTLAAGVTDWTVKARVSAPSQLKEIKLYKKVGTGNEELLETFTDFDLMPNVYNVNYVVTGITAETTIRINAIDKDGKPTSRTFLIKVTP